ncbi:MAG: protein kinase [Pyrinomonadaceae bacterium]|nr:protein kinase [Pyrinomonadaceae bacterium]
METHNWSQISEILVDCLEKDPPERRHYLDGLKLRPEIRAEIENLIAIEKDVDNSLELSAVDFSSGFFDSSELESASVGQQFGDYKVIGELGYGGMGAVYLAERTDGKFEQKVALKLLKREMNTAAVRRRFDQERSILASLEHPNIARLLDAGTTGDKIPYIAMEYVNGLPIDDYCSRHDLNLNQRLELFREVCFAVDFAHRNLIVHRDLKPSNILVNEGGKPKLLDFGISKILSDEVENAGSKTITKLGVMTPSYASPEQIQSKSVTTATDIYSLGVILYELLSGHRPFETKEGDLKEIYKAIIETDPPLPSSVVKETTKHLKEITEAKTELRAPLAHRSVVEESSKPRGDGDLSETRSSKILPTIPHLTNLNPNSIRGDLDNIILKALRKEPERRYSSASNFAEDIKRHLRGLPVSARPNTFAYRTEKFIKRNKISAIAGVLILLTIIGGSIATFWQTRVAQAEREKADRRFDDVRTLANSFIFNLSPKIEKLPGSTPVREELVKLALEYLDSLSKEAGGDAELQRELAAAYEKVGDVQGNQLASNLGDTDGAAESYGKALSIRQNLYDQNPDDLTAMSDLASSLGKFSEIQRQVGTTELVNEYFQKHYELRQEIARRIPNNFEARKNLAIAIRTKGLALYTEAKYKEAVEQYNRANEINESLLKEQPQDTEVAENFAYMFVYIGEAHGWDNDLAAAETSLKKALELLAPLAAKYPNDQNLQRSLMLAYRKKGASTLETENYEKAVEEYQKALEIAENLLNNDPQNFRAKWDVVAAKRHLADALGLAGRNDDSLRIIRSAVDTAEKISEDDRNNPKNIYEIANTRFKMGETYLSMKDYESALSTFIRSNGEYRKVVDLDPKYRFAVRTIHLGTLSIADTYAALAQRRGDKELYVKALDAYQNSLNGFQTMKNEGKLGAFDDKLFPEIETAIKTIRNKLKK